jgi:hypothetical protein
VPKTPFVLNKTGRLDTLEEYLVHARDWREMTGCPSLIYEYHFWKHQFYAPGVLSFAKRIFADIESYVANGFNGMIEDGSQRSYFPNGLSWFVYASKLFDLSCDFDALVEDYFSHAYGETWRDVLSLFERLDEYMPQSYIEQKHSIKNSKDTKDVEVAALLRNVDGICDELDSLLAENKNMPMRAQTVAVRLLLRYTEYCRGLAKALILRASGEDAEAKVEIDAFANRFGAYEIELERYYDHKMMCGAIKALFKKKMDLLQ